MLIINVYKTLSALHPRDSDLPNRAYQLQLLTAFLRGRFYDPLTIPYSEETDGTKYIPTDRRRPSVTTNLCATVVSDSVGMVFGEGRFPTLECGDRPTRDALTDLIKETRLRATMIDAAIIGSVGSVAIQMRVLKGRVFFDVLETTYLTPVYDPEEPDTLLTVTEKYKVKGSDLNDLGYPIDQDMLRADWWYQRVWDTDSETWYQPWPVPRSSTNGQDKPHVPVIDQDRSKSHGLKFVPIVWIKNLPGGDVGSVDGASTFSNGLNTQIKLDYQESQLARLLSYNADPMLVITEPTVTEGGEIKIGGGNVISLGAESDAKLLEMGGSSASALIDSIRLLRELCLEQIHGNRTAPDKMSLPQSGKAMEMLNAPLVSLADNLRMSYGEDALLHLLKMVARASEIYPLKLNGADMPVLSKAKLSLRWPSFFAPTEADKNAQAMTLQILKNAGLVSRYTAVAVLASNLDVEDLPAELARIDSDIAEEDARAKTNQATITATQSVAD